MAKTIAPVTVWVNGVNKEAKILDSYGVNLVLNVSAKFFWALFAQNEDGARGEQIASGNIDMDGADYQAWDQDEYAWDYIASKLNLTITGEYIPPVPVVEETPIEEVI